MCKHCVHTVASIRSDVRSTIAVQLKLMFGFTKHLLLRLI